MPFPLIVELKLCFNSVLEELHGPHLECIMFLSAVEFERTTSFILDVTMSGLCEQ